MVCGFVQPPKEFQDPDLELAQKLDLRQDDADPNGMDVSDVAGVEDSINDVDRDGLDDESGLPMDGLDASADPDLVCPVCGTGFSSKPKSVSMEDPMAGSLDRPDPEQEANARQAAVGPPVVPDETDPEPEGEEPGDPTSELENAAEGDVCPVCGEGVLVPPGEAQAEMGEDPEAAGELGAPGSKVPGEDPESEPDAEDPEKSDGAPPFESDEESEDPADEAVDGEEEQKPFGDSDEESPEEDDDEESPPPFESDEDEEDDENKPAGHTPWHR